MKKLNPKKILFILKSRNYGNNTSSYGLINSSNQVVIYLESLGNTCKVVSVADSNRIDKEVYEFKPDIVIIEALWVSACKFEELFAFQRYKNVKWFVRIHSDVGFLSAETHAFKYINDYLNLDYPNLWVSTNNLDFNEKLSKIFHYDFTYLPNIISLNVEKDVKNIKSKETGVVNIGCFGSLRLLKNQCYQALCAIHACNILGKKLRFHITVDIDVDPYDIENTSNSVLKNLIEIFKACDDKHELVIHTWLPNTLFHKLIKTMDLGMQLSYTESFNIVAADFVNNNKLILVSKAIDWLPEVAKTSTTDYNKTTWAIVLMYWNRNNFILKAMNVRALKKFNKLAKSKWAEFIK